MTDGPDINKQHISFWIFQMLKYKNNLSFLFYYVEQSKSGSLVSSRT